MPVQLHAVADPDTPLAQLEVENEQLRMENGALAAENERLRAVLTRIRAEFDEPGHITRAELDTALADQP